MDRIATLRATLHVGLRQFVKGELWYRTRMTHHTVVVFTIAVLSVVTAAGASDESASCDAISRQSYLAHISATSSALRLNQTEQAKRWLDAAPETFRDWEWKHLSVESDRSVASISFGDATPLSVAHHPTDSLVATAMDDHSIRLIRTDPLAEIGRLDLHQAVVYRAAFSPDGSRLASTGRDFMLRLVHLGTRKELWSVATPAQGISSIAFHPDGSRLALVSWHRVHERVRGLVLIHDAATGEELERMEFGDKPIVAVEFSPDGEKLAVGTWGWRVAIWSFPELGNLRVLDLDDVPVYAAIDDIAFSPDGSSIAAASKDKIARVWTLTNGRRAELSGHSQPVAAVEFAPDGAIVATASWDSTLALYDSRTASRVATLQGHVGRIHDLTFAPDGKTIITVSTDRSLRVWRPEESLAFTDPRGRNKNVYALPLSRDGSLLATNAPGGALGVWNTASGRLIRTLDVADDLVNSAAFSPDRLSIVSCTWDAAVVVTDVATGERRFTFSGPTAGSADCGYSPDGSLVYSSTSDGLYLWDMSTGELNQRIDHDGAVARTVWMPDRPRFATLTGAGALTMWSRTTMQPVWRIEAHDDRGMALAISCDGLKLASAGANGTIRIWNATDGSLVREMSGHSAGVWSLAFHPSGRRLASGSQDQSVRIWDLISGEFVLIIADWSQSVYNVVFSPDGERLYVNSSGAEIRILDASSRVQ
jgi:WD40 repeat protein